MKTNLNDTLEFTIILEQLSQLALSVKAKEKLLDLKPFLNESECKAKMSETTEALKIIESIGTPPLASMEELNKNLDLAEKGSMLIPEQLMSISSFISSCKRMKNYLKRAEILDVGIAFYGSAFNTLDKVFEEIEHSIRNGMVDNDASSALRDLRRKVEYSNSAIKSKLESMLRGKKECFADNYIVTRRERFVLPVKKEYKNQINGTVIDTSGTGNTLFIEPTAVRNLQEELSLYQIAEENEIRKILYTLTDLVVGYINELKINIDCMETLDFLFAKAKLSLEMKAISVPISTERKIKIVAGRHPFLNQDNCVPLDFEIGGNINGVIITGPNTGGKTVVLKTVGLLSLMAQSGLHVPVGEGSIFSMHNNVLADIGDGQSITENLSTFSSHIKNIIDILKLTSNESLVLLDELGSGTDPAEGMGLAISILEELNNCGCLIVATTHYPEIKDYAKNTERLINARMDFDQDSLQPLYKLQIGEAGESCALFIARRLGFPEHMLKRAYEEAYGNKDFTKTNIQTMEFKENIVTIASISSSKIQKEVSKNNIVPRSSKFSIGDSVMVYPKKSIGIIYKLANEKGELGVQIKKNKQRVNHKRIKLLTPATELYPENYDFSIIFDSVENRKARHKMEKKHDSNITIKYDEVD